MSNKWKSRFINAFKRNPKAIIGITKPHIIVHTVKIFHKHGIISIILPFTALAVGMSALPQSIVWAIFIASSGYLFITINRKSNKRRKENEHA